jgi:hypothetical protein
MRIISGTKKLQAAGKPAFSGNNNWKSRKRTENRRAMK